MNATSRPRTPVNLSLRLPPDVSAVLHRRSFETGTAKRDLVIDALRRAYCDEKPSGPEPSRT